MTSTTIQPKQLESLLPGGHMVGSERHRKLFGQGCMHGAYNNNVIVQCDLETDTWGPVFEIPKDGEQTPLFGLTLEDTSPWYPLYSMQSYGDGDYFFYIYWRCDIRGTNEKYTYYLCRYSVADNESQVIAPVDFGRFCVSENGTYIAARSDRDIYIYDLQHGRRRKLELDADLYDDIIYWHGDSILVRSGKNGNETRIEQYDVEFNMRIDDGKQRLEGDEEFRAVYRTALTPSGDAVFANYDRCVVVDKQGEQKKTVKFTESFDDSDEYPHATADPFDVRVTKDGTYALILWTIRLHFLVAAVVNLQTGAFAEAKLAGADCHHLNTLSHTVMDDCKTLYAFAENGHINIYDLSNLFIEGQPQDANTQFNAWGDWLNGLE